MIIPPLALQIAIPATVGILVGVGAYQLMTPRWKAGPMPAPHKNISPERLLVRENIWELGSKVGEEIGMPGLATFMLAQAWAESRYKYNAKNAEGGPNAARGVFQIRPRSALLGEDDVIEQNPHLLFDVPTSVALNAYYLHRLHKWAQTDKITYLALRRGTAFPKLVKDFSESHQRSGEVRGRLEKALDANNIDRSFMYEKAFGDGYSWPGIEAIVELVGADLDAVSVAAGEVTQLPPEAIGMGLDFTEFEEAA